MTRYTQGLKVAILDHVLAVILDIDGPFGGDSNEIHERLQSRAKRQNRTCEITIEQVEEAIEVLMGIGKVVKA
jgi:hypothetical protein